MLDLDPSPLIADRMLDIRIAQRSDQS